MSASYKTLNSDRQWKATTGLSKAKFRELKNQFGKSFKELFGQELWERQSNSTNEAHLKSYGDFLFFVLFSLKSGLTYDALGFVFDMSGANAMKIQREGVRVMNYPEAEPSGYRNPLSSALKNVFRGRASANSLRLNLALSRLNVIPKRIFEDVKAFESSIANDGVLKIDGTEQSVQRPGNQQDQKDRYSGKKKTHRQVDRDK